jgi:hypothetical protein
MSTLKVDTITTISGTGNINLSRPLSGSGASLTSLPAANLTGTLPAIDGSNLTGVAPTKTTVEALGIELPAANLTGSIADARFPATLPASSGVNLTALNASNISSGTLPAGRYTDTVYTHPTTAGNKHIPTAGATDQVLTYSSSGTASWAAPAAGGISDACTWYMSADQSLSSGGTILTGWLEYFDGNTWYGHAPIGQMVTHSNGIFTFPSTGTWLVEMHIVSRTPWSTQSQYVNSVIQHSKYTTQHNWSSCCTSFQIPGHYSTYYDMNTNTGTAMIAVQNISIQNIQVLHTMSNPGTLLGNNDLRTYVRFLKISSLWT